MALTCSREKSSQRPRPDNAPRQTARQQKETVPNPYEHKLFPSADKALEEILANTHPRVVGFGEFHQQNKTAETVSALERFADLMLPVLAGKTSDLVVETWVSQGRCGPVEKKVTTEVDRVTERPKETENETIRLLKKANKLKIRPHILEVQCEDYEKVQDKDGGVDYLALLELVAKRLEEKGKSALSTTGAGADKIVAVYAGAIHNDATPEEMWKSVSFGPALKNAAGGKYIEIDIYVPEFIENSDIVRQESWFPLFTRLASPDKALLIRLNENAYIIGFRKGVSATPKKPASSPR